MADSTTTTNDMLTVKLPRSSRPLLNDETEAFRLTADLEDPLVAFDHYADTLMLLAANESLDRPEQAALYQLSCDIRNTYKRAEAIREKLSHMLHPYRDQLDKRAAQAAANPQEHTESALPA